MELEKQLRSEMRHIFQISQFGGHACCPISVTNFTFKLCQTLSFTLYDYRQEDSTPAVPGEELWYHNLP